MFFAKFIISVTFTAISVIAAYFRLQTDVTLSAAIVISRRPEVTMECTAVSENYVLRNSRTGVSALSRQVSRNVPADAGFLCGKAAVLSHDRR